MAVRLRGLSARWAGRIPRVPPALGPTGRADLGVLGAGALALAVALLGPRLLPDTDPVAVDPYSVRLGVVVLALLAVCALRRRLRSAMPVLLGIASVVLPFVLWSVGPRLIGDVDGDRLSYRATVVVDDALYVLTTAAVCSTALVLARGGRPDLRLRVTGRALGAAVALVLGMVLAFLAIPATWIGRVALPLATLRADLPLLAPAFALQAAAQELAFRGLVLGTLERGLPPWVANLGQALLFGLAHIAVQYEGPTATLVPVTVAVGLALGWVTQRTGSIWPAVIAHAVLEIGQGYGVIAGLYGY